MTIIVSSGHTASNQTLHSGVIEDVLSGGTVVSTTILHGAQLDVFGTASATNVESGALLEVTGSGSAYGPDTLGTSIHDGGVAIFDAGQPYEEETVSLVASGGIAIVLQNNVFIYKAQPGSLVTSVGELLVSAGTTSYANTGASSAQIGSATSDYVLLNTTTTATEIQGGGEQLVFGSSRDAVVGDGGRQLVERAPIASAPGSAIDTVVESGGQQVVYAVANYSTIESGGALTVLSGGTASGATVEQGGFMVVSGGDVTATEVQSGATLFLAADAYADSSVEVESGATLILTGSFKSISPTINAGALVISTGVLTLSQGRVVSTANKLDHAILDSGTTAYVLSHGIAHNVTIGSLGIEIVGQSGSALDTKIFQGGVQTILSGGVADETTIHLGGLQSVAGLASATTVLSGGSQSVAGSAVMTTVEGGGIENVTGVTTSTIVSSGGSQFLVSGAGTASATLISQGGMQLVEAGRAVAANVLKGGIQTVSGFGSAEGTTLEGGKQIVQTYQLGGSADSTTIDNRGVQEVETGYTFSTVVNSGGTQVISGGGNAYDTVVNSGGSAVQVGGVLSGADVEAGGTLFLLGGAANGITAQPGALIVSQGVAFFSGHQVRLAPGATVSGNEVAHGDDEYVLSGGVALSATVEPFASMTINFGGTAIGLVVDSRATLEIDSAGIASSVTVDSYGHITNSGILIDAVVAGELNDSGVASGTVVESFGVVSGNGSLDQITVQSGGTAVAFHSVNGATIETGGTVVLTYEATLSGADILSGGSLLLNGDFSAAGILMHTGGTLDFQSFQFSSTTSAILSPFDVLTIQNSLQDRVQVDLRGNYSGKTFMVSDDGNGGSLVTLAPASGANFLSGGWAALSGTRPWLNDRLELPSGAPAPGQPSLNYSVSSHVAVQPALPTLEQRPGNNNGLGLLDGNVAPHLP